VAVTPVTYLDNGGRRLVDCRGCGQAARIEFHGDRLSTLCFAGCDQDLTLEGYDLDRLRAECNGGEPAPEPRGDVELPFVWASELRDATPEEPDWVLDGYLAVGAVTLAAGKPKVGKSTLAWALAEAAASGAGSFLGRRVRGGPVVYLTEESAGTLRHKLPKSRNAGMRVLTRDAAWPKPSWVDLIEGAVAEAGRVGAVLLVIDALSFWASISEGQARDAGAMQRVMDALVSATSSRLAVLLVHHQRKGGGEEGEAVRDSSAIVGAVDVLVEYERVEDAPHTHRRLVGVGRWAQTPPVLVVEHDPRTVSWRVLGEADGRGDAAGVGWRDRLLHALPEEEPGVTYEDIAGLLDADSGSGAARSTRSSRQNLWHVPATESRTPRTVLSPSRKSVPPQGRTSRRRVRPTPIGSTDST
jgi:hypothetical protein